MEEKKLKEIFEKQEKQLRADLDELYHQDTIPNLQSIIEQIKVLEEFSLNQNRFFCLFDQIAFFPVYISDNVMQYGITPEEIYNMTTFQAFKRIYWKQVSIALKVHQWGNKIHKIERKFDLQGRLSFYCGIKLKDNFGKLKTFFLKQKILTFNKYGRPVLSFIEAEDITPVFKSEIYWHRYIANHNGESITRAFFSSGKKKEYADILSKRELEILHLIVDNKDSNTIGQLLGISTETVMKHRKNMLARIGAKDTTALIYLCRLCDLI